MEMGPCCCCCCKIDTLGFGNNKRTQRDIGKVSFLTQDVDDLVWFGRETLGSLVNIVDTYQ